MFLGEFLLNITADDEERTLDGIATYEEETEAEKATIKKSVKYSLAFKPTNLSVMSKAYFTIISHVRKTVNIILKRIMTSELLEKI